MGFGLLHCSFVRRWMACRRSAKHGICTCRLRRRRARDSTNDLFSDSVDAAWAAAPILSTGCARRRSFGLHFSAADEFASEVSGNATGRLRQLPLSFLVITVARTSQQSAAADSDEPTRIEGRIHSAAQNFLLLLNLTFSVSSRLVVLRRAPREQKRNHRTVFPCCPPRPILPNFGGTLCI